MFSVISVLHLDNRSVRYRRKIGLQAAVRDLNKYTNATKNRRKRSRRQLCRLQTKMNVIENIVTHPAQHHRVTSSFPNNVITPTSVPRCENTLEHEEAGSRCEAPERQPVFDVVNNTDEQSDTEYENIDEHTLVQLRQQLRQCGNDMVSILVLRNFGSLQYSVNRQILFFSVPDTFEAVSK